MNQLQNTNNNLQLNMFSSFCTVMTMTTSDAWASNLQAYVNWSKSKIDVFSAPRWFLQAALLCQQITECSGFYVNFWGWGERAKWRLSAGHQSTRLITMQRTLHATILNHPLQQQDSEAAAAKCRLDKPKHLNSFVTILTLLWYPCLGSVDSFRSCWRFWWGRDWQIKYWILFNTNTIW